MSRIYIPVSEADRRDLVSRAAASGLSVAVVARDLLSKALEATRPAQPARWVAAPEPTKGAP